MNDNRYILVVADDSPEMEIALEYACARSKKTSRKIIIATFIEPLDVLTTQGVTEIMKNEARDEAEKLLQRAASYVKDKTGEMPALAVRDSNTIINSLVSQEITNIRVPVMIVPGNFSKDHIALIT